MSTNEKKTEVIRGRVEPALRKRADTYILKSDRSESYLVRTAVKEFLDKFEIEIPQPKAMAEVPGQTNENLLTAHESK